MEDRRRQEAEKEAAARCATEKQILEDAEHLIAVWNERQAKRMPMLFSPTSGAATTAGLALLTCSPCRVNASLDLYCGRRTDVAAADITINGFRSLLSTV
jgi:hypothetical protein